jgi:hypothetical protein
MKATHLIQVLIILIMSSRVTVALAAPLPQTSVSLTKPAGAVVKTNDAATVAQMDEIAYWTITDEDSRWTTDEAKILRRALQATFGALAVNGIDGMVLLDGYRFRHDAGDYVDDVEGRMGIIDHNTGEIVLSDKAFTVMNGFPIYHELGHAVDQRLNRQLSEGFQRYTSGPVISEDDNQWQTADNYWLRSQGRYDREEAAADAFAIMVMVSFAGLTRPIFAQQPITTDYDGISAAAALALHTSDLNNR